ncbi:hypothetical protein ACWEBX_36040 [Streptomyces sp. NPDC005070]
MQNMTEAGFMYAARTGSYNHNEIVVPVGVDTEVDEGIELGLTGSMRPESRSSRD